MTFPVSFVQDRGASICMQASRLQQTVKAWVDAAFQGRDGDTDGVLNAIGDTMLLLHAERELIIERQKVAAQKADTSS